MRLIRRLEAVILTTAMLAFPVLGAAALHRLSAVGWLTIGWSDPLAWIGRTPPEDMAAAILRHLGLAGCYWLTVASVAYVAGRLAGLSRVLAALEPLTPRIVKSVADRAVVGAVALSSLGISPAPAMADQHQPPIVDPIDLRASVADVSGGPPTRAFVRDDFLPYDSRTPIRAILDTQSEPQEPPIETEDTIASVRDDYLPRDHHPPIPAAPDTKHQETVEVRSGDSLWLISSRHLARDLGRPPTQDEIRAHWRATIDANLPDLRSGDPNLIHPGETIFLPPAREG